MIEIHESGIGFVKLSNSKKKAIISLENYVYTASFNWYLFDTKASSFVIKSGSRFAGKQISLACFVMNDLENKFLYDHIDRNIFNNQKENLRLATAHQNSMNKGRYVNNTSGYKGVWKHRNSWVAEMKIRGKKYSLGSYATKEEAALAYNEAAKKAFGEFACLNKIDGIN